MATPTQVAKSSSVAKTKEVVKSGAHTVKQISTRDKSWWDSTIIASRHTFAKGVEKTCERSYICRKFDKDPDDAWRLLVEVIEFIFQ